MKTRVPIFVGWTEDKEKVVLYNKVGTEGEYHLKVGDGEVWALAPGTELHTWSDPAVGSYHIKIVSSIWTGSATGTRYDAQAEEAI